MTLQDLVVPLASLGCPVFIGYPTTGAPAPYATLRPALVQPSAVAIGGRAIGWVCDYVLYCTGASVEASYNLAVLAMGLLQGARVGDSTLSVSLGYSGNLVEGAYDSAVTIDVMQGALT